MGGPTHTLDCSTSPLASAWGEYKAAHGLVDVADLVERHGCSRQTVRNWVGKLEVGSLVEVAGLTGPRRRVVFTEDEADRIAAELRRPHSARLKECEAKWLAYKTEHELVDIHDVAERLGYSEAAVLFHVRRLELGQRVRLTAGRGGRFAFTADEVRQVEAAFAAAARGEPRSRSRRYFACLGCDKPVRGAEWCPSCRHEHRSGVMRERWDAARAEIAQLKAEGYRDVAELAAQVDRSATLILQRAKRLGVGTRVGTTAKTLLFSPDDAAAIAASVQFVSFRDDLRAYATWYRRRFGTIRGYAGRLANTIALERGKRIGRPRGYSSEQAERVYALKDSGFSIREIASTADLGRGTVERILKARA